MPYCPQCEGEYEAGVTMCAQCRIALVEGSPVPDMDAPDAQSEEKYVTVFIAQDSADARAVKAILGERDIPYVAEAEGGYPQDGSSAPGTTYVEYRVESGRSREALELLKDLIERDSDGGEPVDRSTRSDAAGVGEEMSSRDRAQGLVTGAFLLLMLVSAFLPFKSMAFRLMLGGVLTVAFITVSIIFFWSHKE